jgi:hypothetical protein
MRTILVLAAVLAVFVFAGCVGPSVPAGGGGPNPAISGTGGGAQPGQHGAGGQAQANTSAGPFSAKDGLDDADTAISVIRKNVSLVGITGDCGPDGKSAVWQYSFDSTQTMKGYVVTVPVSESWPRDTSFSTNRALPAQWVDSAAAVSACGHGGECSLEMSQGKPAWTIISGQDSCQVDAVSGQVTG